MKTTTDFFKKILGSIETVEDCHRLKKALDLVGQDRYRTGKSSEKSGHLSFFSEEVAWYLSSGGDPKSFFEDARATLKQMPVLSLEVAFDPDEKSIRRISSWARGNVHPNAVLDFARDRSLGAGARVMFEGRYFEENLDTMVQRVIENVNIKVQNDREKSKND